MDAALARDLTPWEQRAQLGALRGFLETLKGAAFSPATFFDRLRPETSWAEAFWYGWLLQAVSGTVPLVLALLPMMSLHGGAVRGLSELGGSLMVALAPVVLYPAIVLTLAAVVHLLALLTHQSHRGLASTMRAVCYSGVTLGLVATLGLLGLWGLLIGVYALARLQQMRPSRAALLLVGAGLLLVTPVIVPLTILVARGLP